MTKKKDQPPKQILLSPADTDALKQRIQAKKLVDKDFEVIMALLVFYVWLHERLSRAKLSIKRLRSLFGFTSEARKKPSPTDTDPAASTSPDDDSDPPTDPPPVPDASASKGGEAPNIQPPRFNPDANHGRYGSVDYSGCPEEAIDFDDEHLQQGRCPECAACDTVAKVVPQTPCVLLRFTSQPLVSGTRYQLQRARCCVCQRYFTAPLPAAVAEQPKYAPSCRTAIAVHHYYGGLPFKRIETLQQAQGVPLADATQYDLMQGLYSDVIRPIAGVLTQQAAQGQRLFFDDTSNRVLSQVMANKAQAKRSDRASVHATVLLSEHQGHRITLFNTNTQPAGQVLADLLSARETDEPFITMSDALAHNFPELDESLMASWVISLCLAHGRRRFVELLSEGDPTDDAAFVLNIIGQVYHHESHCRQRGLDPEARLAYHQKHSGPLMAALRIWFNNLLQYRRVEPNSPLGEAIAYCLKRWQWLTQFLQVPGAALDNNIAEQAVKVVIRYRKNSHFYRTFHGAEVGDAMMSVMHTAVQCGVDVFDYLNTVQAYSTQVGAQPDLWLPWCYQQTRAVLETTQAVA